MDEAKIDKKEEDLVKLQNTQTTAMGVGNYSMPINIVKYLSIRLIKAFQPLSTL